MKKKIIKTIKTITVRLSHLFILLLALALIMIFGKPLLFYFSVAFLLIAGIVEEVFLQKFYSPQKRIPKKGALLRAVLWVHSPIMYIKRHGIKIYNFEKTGYLTSIFAYLIILFYVVITLAISFYSDWAVLIYLIPVITNIVSFWKNNYIIYVPKSQKNKKKPKR
ncbi:hypothetical protein GF378_00330 [Candidatus Pacearchaeota archaeon]|nr:hypothetical protein [Candidatus Pacearchaeota archaeon]